MTDNHTSKAVTDIFSNPLDPRTVLAIQQKFQFMENTLIGIVSGTHSRDLRQIHQTAQDALTFDPLSA